MTKHGEGLGLEIVKGVNQGILIEPLTTKKVKDFCKLKGLNATENHMSVILANATSNNHSPTYRKFFERISRGEYRVINKYRGYTNINSSNEKEWYQFINIDENVERSLKDSSEKRMKRLERIFDKHPKVCTFEGKQFLRNPDVIAEVLYRADGKCEKCNKDAPFIRKSNGSPYLVLSDTLQPEQKSHCFLQTYEKNYTVLSELRGINRVATHYSNLV
jgi:hypothetical protein